MSDLNHISLGDNGADLDAVSASIKRLSEKVQSIAEAIKELHQNRTQLEGKIEDAQKRIQHILSRLPEKSDGRQLNLLNEATPPNTPEDDSEPTTH
jgi:predicted  nucleic acid-binding Zn-ribbon protein